MSKNAKTPSSPPSLAYQDEEQLWMSARLEDAEAGVPVITRHVWSSPVDIHPSYSVKRESTRIIPPLSPTMNKTETSPRPLDDDRMTISLDDAETGIPVFKDYAREGKNENNDRTTSFETGIPPSYPVKREDTTITDSSVESMTDDESSKQDSSSLSKKQRRCLIVIASLFVFSICCLGFGMIGIAIARSRKSDSDTAPTESPSASPTACPTTLLPNQNLYPNSDLLCSPDGRYMFGLDVDSDLSIWDADTNNKIWSAGTASALSLQRQQVEGGDAYLRMQTDGNAVVYVDSPSQQQRQVLWSSNTYGNEGAFLTVENDGRFTVQTKTGQVLWGNSICGYVNFTKLEEPGANIFAETRPDALDDVVDRSTLHHKMMAGYQGWFGTPCDGVKNDWVHWSKFDAWPDLREYEQDELCPRTDFPDRAGLFSSFNAKTVDRHVRWMQEYGIDGVYVQRFIHHDLSHRDIVLNSIRKGAEQYGRVFANMYDISSADPVTVYDDLKNDWMHLVDTHKITQSDRYLFHDGRPVLAIWGFGFANRVGDPAAAAEMMDWFQNSAEERYRVTLMGGVPTYWRTLGKDSKTDLAWAEVYRKYDIISPWTVGRFRDDDSADHFRANTLEPDQQECNALGIEYLPVVWPGFSFNSRYPEKPFNDKPRRGGRFFWKQISNAVEAGSSQIYVAMFDEVDEGTAIFKVAENSDQTPTGGGQFLTLDLDGFKLPSDWYLRLMGSATRMLRESGVISSIECSAFSG